MRPPSSSVLALAAAIAGAIFTVAATAAPPAPKPSASAAARASASAKAGASARPSALAPKGSASATKPATSAHPAPSTSGKPGALLPVPKLGAVTVKGGPLLPVPKPGKRVAALGNGWTPPGYAALVKIWHAPAPKAPTDDVGRPKLVLNSLNRTEKVELVPTDEAGDFAPAEVDKATWVIRCGEDQHPIDARLLNLVYAIQKHFGAGEIRFISAYRAPYKGQGSNHGYGRAMDLVVPGATDEEVATYARSLGFAGVGIYPISGFVHVDVRERSFFWVDRSGPGQPNRTTGILAGEAAAADAKARKEGRIGAPTLAIGGSVDAALATRAKAVTGSATAFPPAAPPSAEEADLDDDADYD